MATLKYIKLVKNWNISYNAYSDLFQIYDNSIFNSPKNSILEKRIKNIRIILDSKSKEPKMLEIKNVYRELGVEIENLEKRDIIRLLEPYFYKYV